MVACGFPICQVRVTNQCALTLTKQMCLRALVRFSFLWETPTVGTCVFMTNKNYHISLLVHQRRGVAVGVAEICHLLNVFHVNFKMQWPEWNSTGHFVLKNLKMNIRTRLKSDGCDETGSPVLGWRKRRASVVTSSAFSQQLSRWRYRSNHWSMEKYFPDAGSVLSFAAALHSTYYKGTQRRANSVSYSEQRFESCPKNSESYVDIVIRAPATSLVLPWLFARFSKALHEQLTDRQSITAIPCITKITLWK